MKQPEKSATKYKGVTFGLWSNDLFPILNPTMKVAQVCIGSDKLGHFLQQGRQYLDLVQSGGKASDAEEWGERSEGGRFGLITTGVFSNADLEANRQGLRFYQDLMKAPTLAFDIGKYISEKWNEEKNPSYYEQSVAEQVWSNLLTREWHGTFTETHGRKSKLKVNLQATPTAITGAYALTSAGGEAKAGVISNGKLQFVTKAVKGSSFMGQPVERKPVSGVEITFQWSEGSASGLAILKSINESVLSGSLGTNDSTNNRGTWEIK